MDDLRDTPVPEAHEALAERFETAFEAWNDDPRAWPAGQFEGWALAAYRLQYAANRPYARYCHAIGRTPDVVATWQDIPPVPTAAFRAVELIVGDPADAELRFRTSGTTGGSASRGVHLVRRPATYRAAIRGTFRRAVLGGQEHHRLLLLHPAFEPSADSSLAFMFDTIFEGMSSEGSVRVDPGSDDAHRTAIDALEAAAAAGAPLVVAGTTLAHGDLLDACAAADVRLELPAGSRLMDTGGTKGREGLDRDAVLAGLLDRFNLDEAAAVNEFGMTELLSQRYGDGLGRVALRGPPWLRTRCLDPVTLEDRQEGDEGILCHFDLANVGSVIGVLTEDRGRVVGDAVEWLGRTPGSMPRGCSIATAELLEAQA